MFEKWKRKEKKWLFWLQLVYYSATIMRNMIFCCYIASRSFSSALLAAGLYFNFRSLWQKLDIENDIVRAAKAKYRNTKNKQTSDREKRNKKKTSRNMANGSI